MDLGLGKSFQILIASNADGGQEFSPIFPKFKAVWFLSRLLLLLLQQLLQQGEDKLFNSIQDWFDSEVGMKLFWKELFLVI